jgi:rhamnulokinase
MNEVSGDRDPVFGDKLAAKVGKKPVLAAVDLGAESCRVSLLRWNEGQPEIRLVHRFANSRPKMRATASVGTLLRSRGRGRRLARLRAGLLPKESLQSEWTVGLWTTSAWARRTTSCQSFLLSRRAHGGIGQKLVHARISPDRLYQLTGVQILALNTLYQLR